jgi:DNA polymerase-3 subunit gamma/tau
MVYLAYYRKYRPQTFEEIVGQEHITRTLQNAIIYNRLSHAYLFSGPRGTGKTTTARILAKALNCEKGPTPIPCNKCEMCKRISDGFALDIIEIDAASNRGIEEIRDLREKIKFAPAEGRFKVYIIDEVHMLTEFAFNALLKTLEEPPPHVIFVLATTEQHKIPLTIISRCQHFDFRRITPKDISLRLKEIAKKENLKIEEKSINLIANSVEGSLRDALSILDQLVSYKGEDIKEKDVISILGIIETQVFEEFINFIAERNYLKIIQLIEKISNEGRDLKYVIKTLLNYFRELLVLKISEKNKVLVEKEFGEEFLKQKDKFKEEEILEILRHLSSLESQIKWEQRPRVLIEVGMIKLLKILSPEEKEIQENVKVEEESEIFLERIRREWKNVVEEVKKENIKLWPILESAVPLKLEGNILKLGFDVPFNKEHLSQIKNRIFVEEILKKIFQKEFKIICVDVKEKKEIKIEEDSSFLEETLNIFPGSRIVARRRK